MNKKNKIFTHKKGLWTIGWSLAILAFSLILLQLGYVFIYAEATMDFLFYVINACIIICVAASVLFLFRKKVVLIPVVTLLMLLFGANLSYGLGYERPEGRTSPAERSGQERADQNPKGNKRQAPEASVEVSITIPEGWTFMQIAEELENKGICTKEEFFKAAQDYEPQSFSIPSSPDRAFKLEGYLFPDTYTFYTNEDPVNVIRTMLNNFVAKSGMPSDETLILASMIEKEARSDKNMKLVSSVIKNRLENGQRLEMDSTRVYVNDFITNNPLLTEDTAKYAPLYNTYRCNALPPGPICNPSARAIAAAMNPTPSEYLFFFFGDDHRNHYSKTYAEHLEKMEQIGVQYE